MGPIQPYFWRGGPFAVMLKPPAGSEISVDVRLFIGHLPVIFRRVLPLLALCFNLIMRPQD